MMIYNILIVAISQNILPIDGEAYLFPEFFSKEESEQLWEALQKNIHWKQEPVVIMSKKVMQPRLTAWYGDEGKSYRYTGITMHPHPWTKELLLIKERIEELSGQVFNTALLNCYRNGNDSIGWHRDNEKSLGINPVIGSVSFGAARYFHFRHYQQKHIKEKILLTPGSFLLMKGETQHKWFHSIQKEPHITGGRINITFRTII
ncbi:alpha-ketoglutarate-dependent dioxygenase AlkB family protein [Agriterribacter humi]|uniref:alpha-ketoglutarate-dependent dioxygenase AlkB family protein n=1 Tax=Agriterribacter humi TaxID=1104781 RepID=UPI001D022AE0|nr:alpha-ketoglutarate-dependent dioxygenase AlkB [Agriterribacter humi]